MAKRPQIELQVFAISALRVQGCGDKRFVGSGGRGWTKIESILAISPMSSSGRIRADDDD